MGTMLSLQEVTKIYPGAEHIKAVDRLSFDLEEWLGHPGVARLQP